MSTVRATPRLLVDARPICHPETRGRGIGRYVAELIRALDERGAAVQPVVGTSAEREVVEATVALPPVRMLTPGLVDASGGDAWWIATGMFLRPLTFDPIPRFVSIAGLRVASVLYDVIPYRDPDRYQADPGSKALFALRAQLARTADVSLAISAFTARKAALELELPRETTHVIGAGAAAMFSAGPPDVNALDEMLPHPPLPYVVSVTGGDERKNTRGLIEAWALLPLSVRAAHRLVVVAELSGEVRRRWLSWADDAGCADEVVFTGAVTDDQLIALLRGSALAVMPSLDEGFGLPVLEAASCGVPVICSATSALPEVLDLPSATFDPLDREAMASLIVRALGDPDFRRTLLDAGGRATQRWSWPQVAARVIEATTKPPRRAAGAEPRARRVALIGPFTGSPSGIGPYNDHVVSSMRGRGGAELTCFAELLGTGLTTPPRAWPADSFGRARRVHDFDDVIATFGSSPFHTGALDASVGAHVWLHESSLIGLHVGRAHRSASPEWSRAYLADQVRRNEGEAALQRLFEDGPGALLDPGAYRAAGIRLIAEPVRAARSVIVSSADAADDVLRADAGAKVLVLPLAIPTVAPAASSERIGRTIVVAGWLAANKRCLDVLDVLALMPDDVSLDFVGPIQGDAASEVVSEAQRRGLGTRVTVHGAVDAIDYDRLLRRARVGLQLRDGHNGEMSAAVADLLARAVPVVTTLETTSVYGVGSGATVLPSSTATATIADAVGALFADESAWHAASDGARRLASSWTFDDVASALMSWLRDVEAMDRGAVIVAGPNPAS